MRDIFNARLLLLQGKSLDEELFPSKTSHASGASSFRNHFAAFSFSPQKANRPRPSLHPPVTQLLMWSHVSLFLAPVFDLPITSPPSCDHQADLQPSLSRIQPHFTTSMPHPQKTSIPFTLTTSDTNPSPSPPASHTTPPPTPSPRNPRHKSPHYH